MAKRLVVCMDGTWNKPSSDHPTNVVKIARAIEPVAEDGTQQVVYYHAGVGTGNALDQILGGTLGKGLQQNIRDGYRFLAPNYAEGDELFIFGFSRGSFTARSLLGMIRQCGLLRKTSLDRLPEAYELYRDDSHPDDATSGQFRADYSREVKVKCIGVWDTVGALGVPGTSPWSAIHFLRAPKFHDVNLTGLAENAFHALAIDERRRSFKPSLWSGDKKPGQRVMQVWFPGVHSNIGGGFRDTSLSDGALHWMVERAKECGLEVNDSYLDETTSPNPTGWIGNSLTGIFRFTGSYLRPIGVQSTEAETVSVAARERLAAPAAAYRPQNLLDYVDSHD